MRPVNLATLVALTIILLATGYEAAFALGVLDIGSLPGQGPPGSDIALITGMLTLLTASIVSGTSALISSGSGILTAILGLTGTAFVTARYFTFDPYYAPSLRRISDGGAVSAEWMALLVVAAIVAAVVTLRFVGLGRALTSLVLVICAFTALWQGAGH